MQCRVMQEVDLTKLAREMGRLNGDSQFTVGLGADVKEQGHLILYHARYESTQLI